jgi:hypothetical protein
MSPRGLAGQVAAPVVRPSGLERAASGTGGAAAPQAIQVGFALPDAAASARGGGGGAGGGSAACGGARAVLARVSHGAPAHKPPPPAPLQPLRSDASLATAAAFSAVAAAAPARDAEPPPPFRPYRAPTPPPLPPCAPAVAAALSRAGLVAVIDLTVALHKFVNVELHSQGWCVRRVGCLCASLAGTSARHSRCSQLGRAWQHYQLCGPVVMLSIHQPPRPRHQVRGARAAATAAPRGRGRPAHGAHGPRQHQRQAARQQHGTASQLHAFWQRRSAGRGARGRWGGCCARECSCNECNECNECSCAECSCGGGATCGGRGGGRARGGGSGRRGRRGPARRGLAGGRR